MGGGRAPSKKRQAPKKVRAKSYKRQKVKYGATKRGFSTNIARPLGKKLNAKFRYSDSISINPGAAGAAGVHVFSANGLYDPDVTSTGHQPTGFDEVSALYDHYTVTWVKIRCFFLNGDTTYSGICGISLKDNANVETDWRAYDESGLSNTGVALIQGGQSDPLVLEHEVTLSEFLGRPNILSEDDLRGTPSTNPTEQAYWHVWVAPGVSQDMAASTVIVEMEYMAIFTEPKIVGLS